MGSLLSSEDTGTPLNLASEHENPYTSVFDDSCPGSLSEFVAPSKRRLLCREWSPASVCEGSFTGPAKGVVVLCHG